jgi:hypothetical protein
MAKNRNNLWQFAVDYAVYLHNHLPLLDIRVSPLEKLTNNIFPNYNHLIRAHTFGCPVYVLDPRLQDSKKIPKWSMRSRRGVYLGVSKNHSSKVHLIINPDTGAISPQYHRIFDDSFSTVWSDGQFDQNLWECLVSQVENIERHSCLQPNRDGTVDLPPGFVPFSPDMTGADQPNRRELPNIDSNQNNITNNNDDRQQPTTSNTLDSPSSPLLSQRIFIPLLPISSSDDIDTPTPQVRRSTRSNLGSAPDRLDPSTHTLTDNHQATDNIGSNVTSIENYCNVLGIKLSSTTRARTISH